MKVQSIKDIVDGPKVSNWHNSEKTKEMVANQIRKIWGESEVCNYNPETSALPFTGWLRLGYRPKKGSKALKSITVVERRDAKGNIKKFSRKINLFYYRSVEPITK